MKNKVIPKILTSAAFSFVAMLFVSGSVNAGGEYGYNSAKNMWSGSYIGLHAGYGEAEYDGLFDSGEPDDETGFLSDLDLDGGIVGIHIGYNWQRNNLVLGIEADVSGTSISDIAQERDNNNTDLMKGNIDFLASLRARVGFAQDSLLIYATGGIAFTDAEYTAIDDDTDGARTVEFDNVGYVIGGGVEKIFSDGGMRLRVEGLYYNFDDTINTSNLTNDSDRDDFAKFEDIWSLRVGLSIPLSKPYEPEPLK